MPNWRMTSTRYRKSAGRQFNSLSAPGGGEGWGEVGDSRALAGTHLTLPSLRDGPLPLPPEGRRGQMAARSYNPVQAAGRYDWLAAAPSIHVRNHNSSIKRAHSLVW